MTIFSYVCLLVFCSRVESNCHRLGPFQARQILGSSLAMSSSRISSKDLGSNISPLEDMAGPPSFAVDNGYHIRKKRESRSTSKNRSQTTQATPREKVQDLRLHLHQAGSCLNISRIRSWVRCTESSFSSIATRSRSSSLRNWACIS